MIYINTINLIIEREHYRWFFYCKLLIMIEL